MQASKPPIGVGLRINFHLNAGRAQLSCHFIQIAYPKVYHPYLARILEIVSRFWERTEHGWTSFLLPNRIFVARWSKGDSQMLLVPASQTFWVFGSEKEASDSGYLLHFRGCRYAPFSFCSRHRGGAPCHRRDPGSLSGDSAARPKYKQEPPQQLTSLKSHHPTLRG